MNNTILFYVHDPMCSWCWGFRPVLQRLQVLLPGDLKVNRVLGGLAPDSGSPMAEELRQYLQQKWQTVQSKIHGTEFNFEYWTNCTPRRSTYPACRAVIAARQQGSQYDEEMTYAIQKAYYREAKNPSDYATLVELATSIGLDPDEFKQACHSAATQQALVGEIELARQLGVQGFPGLVLVIDNTAHRIKIGYTDARPMLDTISAYLSD